MCVNVLAYVFNTYNKYFQSLRNNVKAFKPTDHYYDFMIRSAVDHVLVALKLNEDRS